MNLPLFWKLIRLRCAVKQLVAAKGVRARMFWLGAYDVNPEYLFVVIAVQTDRERDRLRADTSLSEQLMRALATVDWPEAARSHVEFEIESEETVKRESAGSWWIHYK